MDEENGVRIANCPIGQEYCHYSCQYRKGKRCRFNSEQGVIIPELEKRGKAKTMKTIVRCQNDMVLVFDQDEKQVPEYQGQYQEVRESILTDAPPEATFAHGFDRYGGLNKVAREEW